MKRRVSQVKEEISTLELDHPEKVHENMQIQRQEIIKRIQHESEQILYWRRQIENLVNVFRVQDAGTKEET
jgi:acetolactate synthase small subunit